jgi:murein L,D-transpeptidase YcbB/YkuD
MHLKRSTCNHIFASTALGVLIAIPLGGVAKDLAELPAAPSATRSEQNSNRPALATAITAPAAGVTDQAAGASDAWPDPRPAAPAIAAAPLPSLDPADQVVADKLRDLLATKAEMLFPNKKERAAAVAFYENRRMAPLWLDKGVENAHAKSATARLIAADTDGLDPADYKVPNFASLGSDALAEAELKLTRAVLTYARHVQAGRFSYTQVSRNIELPQAAPEPADILEAVANSDNSGEVLGRFSPPQEPYRRLKAKLAELRRQSGSSKSDVSRQINLVIANMERWRWYPRDLGDSHVLVNLPDFTLKVLHRGAQVWTTRIVIGKPSMPTPLLSETMKYITINPTWHVPPSIVYNEYLPALAQDPTVLERMGLHVSYNGGRVEITQPPGDGNALGRVRFNFPNRFSVYQHDTPDKHLFASDFRADSHGCMRVQDPAKYAEVLLGIARPREHWSAARITNMFGRAEQDISFPTPIWVHLTYQTAFVDQGDRLQIRGDVYGLDGRTLAAIKRERGAVSAAAERRREPEKASASPVRKAAEQRTGPRSITYQPPSYARSLAPSLFYR